MEENNTVVVDVDLTEYIKQLDELRKQYSENAKSIEKLADAEGDEAKKRETLIQQNKVLRQEMSGVERQMQNEIKQHKAAEGSLVALRAELGNLQKKYDQMSAFDRLGVEGQAAQEKIAKLSAEIQGLEGATGRWQRNVGNYKSALQGLKGGFEGVGLSTKGLNTSMKLLSANPWMAVIGILIKFLLQLRDKMKDNEKVTKSLGDAMSSLQPIFDWFSKIVSKLADIFSNVLDWAIEKTIDALGWLGRQLQKIGNLFGKDWGSGLVDYSAKMKEAATTTETMATATDDLAASQGSLQGAVKKTRDALETFLDTYKKVLAETKKESLADMLYKAGGTKTAAQVIDEMVQAADQLDVTLKHMDATIDDSNFNTNEPSFVEKLAADFQNNAQTIESVSSSLQSSFSSLSSMYAQMAKDETKTEAERESAAKKAKAWSALQIAANAGTAVAKGISSAMDMPWPANLAAMAATLAAVLSAIAQAKALASQSYETGGVIGGYRGATMGKDNTYVHARTGEMVINAKQQRQLFEIANGGATTSLAASLAAAIQSMPAPVVVYSELEDFGQKVTTLNEMQKLY